MKPVIFHPAASDELEKAADDYEDEQLGLGRRFRIEFEQALERIKRNPLAYAIEIDQFRACAVHRFPYTAFYADFEDHIWLAAVAHQRRRPGYWLRRKPRKQ